MQTGTVIWFDHQKGYGFIQSDADESKQYFTHYTNIISDDKFKSLVGDDKVEFEVEAEKDGSGKERAVNVRRIK